MQPNNTTMRKITTAFVFLFFAASCTKNEHDVKKDDFFYFKSNIGGSPFETFGYRYKDNSSPGGPGLFIRKPSIDSLFVIVNVNETAITFRPLQVGNINAYFVLAKKGLGVEGTYLLDKEFYELDKVITIGADPMFIDTSAAFNFTVTDTSSVSFYGTYADGNYNFTLLKNGVKTSTSGSFRLKVGE